MTSAELMASNRSVLTIIGISGGGTYTRCVLVRSDGTILGRGTGGPANHNFVGPAVVARSVEDALSGALATLPAGAKVDAIGAAILAPTDYFAAALERLLPGVPLHRWEEMEVAALGLVDTTHPGVVLIAGTGSRAVAFRADGTRVAAGGWGMPLGDEGSASTLGWWALQAATRALESYGPQTALLPAVMRFLDAHDRPSIIRRIYHLGLARHELGMLAPAVVACAAEGDAVARQLLERAGHELALLVATVARRAGLHEAPLNVATVGGIFAAGEPIYTPFRAALQNHEIQANLIAPITPSEVGAALITLQTHFL